MFVSVLTLGRVTNGNDKMITLFPKLPLMGSNCQFGVRPSERTRGRKSLSYGDFENALLATGLGRRNVNSEAAFDRFPQVAHQFVHGLALGGAARNGGDFGPEAAFLRIMHHDFNLHSGSPKGDYLPFHKGQMSPLQGIRHEWLTTNYRF
jgi:hypothetical protein